MAINGNSTYVPTMLEFGVHWSQCNAALGLLPLIIRLPDNTTRTLAQFNSMRNSLIIRQDAVLDALIEQTIARGEINLQKEALLTKLQLFLGAMDSSYQRTAFYGAR